MEVTVIKVILVYLILINLIAFITYGVDKIKATKNQWRISEATLIFLAFIGGSLGAYAGMKAWHHKTQKLKFKILVSLSFCIYLVFGYLIYLLMK